LVGGVYFWFFAHFSRSFSACHAFGRWLIGNYFWWGFLMPKPNLDEIETLANSKLLLRFAAENKTGLTVPVISDIQAAWEAADGDQWTAAIATKFWLAYDALCTHLRPVTLDTLAASSLGIKRRRWIFFGPIVAGSLARLTANRYLALLLLTLIVTMFVAFVASTGESLIKEIRSLADLGHREINAFRDHLGAAPPDIEAGVKFNDSSLTSEAKRWVGELRRKSQSTYFVADRLYRKSDSFVFRILGIGQFEKCGDDTWLRCYPEERLSEPADFESARHFATFFEKTLQEVDARNDRAETILTMLKSYFLPTLFGLLGACTYVVRLISEQIRDSTFTKSSPLRHLLRVALGSLAGVVVILGSLLATAGLSSSALSFIAGYAVEPLFSAIDGIAEKFRR
jgi:hypothetical protein